MVGSGTQEVLDRCAVLKVLDIFDVPSAGEEVVRVRQDVIRLEVGQVVLEQVQVTIDAPIQTQPRDQLVSQGQAAVPSNRLPLDDLGRHRPAMEARTRCLRPQHLLKMMALDRRRRPLTQPLPPATLSLHLKRLLSIPESFLLHNSEMQEGGVLLQHLSSCQRENLAYSGAKVHRPLHRSSEPSRNTSQWISSIWLAC